MTTANAQLIAQLLTQSTIENPAAASAQDIQAVINAGQEVQAPDINAETANSSSAKVTTTTQTIPKPVLPSTTPEGQKTIAAVDNAIDRNINRQAALATEANSQLATVLGLEDKAREASTDLATAQVQAMELEQANKVAVAKESVGFNERYDNIVNDPTKNERLNRSLEEASVLQAELAEMTTEGGISGVLKRMFIAPNLRRNLAAVQNSNLASMKLRGQATTNYFNNMQQAAHQQNQVTAEEMATIALDKASAEAAFNDYVRQGQITDVNMANIAKTANMNEVETSAYLTKMKQLANKDSLVLGDFQAAIESTKLEYSQKQLAKASKASKANDLLRADMQAEWERYHQATGNEMKFKDVMALYTKQPNAPEIQAFNTWRSRTKSMSATRPWTDYLLSLEDGTFDPSNPLTAQTHRRHRLMIQDYNARTARQNASEEDPNKHLPLLDMNSKDPEMVSRINDELVRGMKADAIDISSSVNSGAVQFQDFDTLLKNTPEEEWGNVFPTMNARELKFIKEGGMEKVPTAISRDPAITIPRIINTMVEDVIDLPVEEARTTILMRAKIIGKQYAQQFKGFQSNGYSNIGAPTVLGVEVSGTRGTVSEEFTLTKESDWAIRAMGAYIQAVRTKKLTGEATTTGMLGGF